LHGIRLLHWVLKSGVGEVGAALLCGRLIECLSEGVDDHVVHARLLVGVERLRDNLFLLATVVQSPLEV